jgi:hypothetical protein
MTLLAAALNPKFAALPVFTPHPAFTPEPTPIYDSLCEGRVAPKLEHQFIQRLCRIYSYRINTVWEDA